MVVGVQVHADEGTRTAWTPNRKRLPILLRAGPDFLEIRGRPSIVFGWSCAGDFAESWIWIWNLPMPIDADDALLHWKRGVSTVGLQGITALHTGGADEYLDCAVALYARLYNYAHDPHYLEVTRVLLHDTKSMVALPGRLYDMRGPGWQQENFGLGPGPRGRGEVLTVCGCPGSPPIISTESMRSKSTTPTFSVNLRQIRQR